MEVVFILLTMSYLAKLYAHRFNKKFLWFTNLFLRGRKRRNKINSSYSVFAEILFSVPQGSKLGLFFLTFTSVTSFVKIATVILLVMLMAIHRNLFVIFKLQKNTKNFF